MNTIKVLTIIIVIVLLSACAGVSKVSHEVETEAKSKGIPIVFNWIRHDPPNSAGGVNAWVFFVNTSEKPIKYVRMNMEAYNRVGDAVPSRIGGDKIKILQAVGPFEPGRGNGGNFWQGASNYENVWYNNSITCIRVHSADVEYMDGSEESIGPEQIADAVQRGVNNTC